MRQWILLFCLWWIYQKVNVPPLESDILIAPGGYKGIYMLGICHYLKNHFEIEDKIITGLSCGSLLSLFLKLTPDMDHLFISSIFKINHNVPMCTFLQELLRILFQQFKTEDFDLTKIQIGVTTLKGFEVFNKFLNLKDVVSCCTSSCFVPFVTYKDLFLIYHNRMTFDGGLFYKVLKHRKKENTTIISSYMFGRYKESLISGFIKPRCSYYQLYLNGYHDARKNHAYFEKRFKSKAMTKSRVHRLPS
jgi:hypothetical protein